jgi:shikimate 5-dehydrogenase
VAAIAGEARASCIPLATPPSAGPEFDPTLVISTLPGTDELASLALAAFPAGARPIVVDLAYAGLGRPSPLVEKARAAGLVASDGLALLVEQAALSLAGWTGGDLSRIRAAMRAAVAL